MDFDTQAKILNSLRQDTQLW